MNVQDLISTTIILLYGITFMMYLITGNVYHIIVAIGLWGTAGISEFIKHHIIKTYSPRPEGAFNCNVLCTDGSQAGKPGMPSSHAAASIFFVIMYWKYTKNPYVRTLLLIYYLLILQSRYFKNCHSIPQLIVGSLVGFSTSAIVLKYTARLL